MLRASKTGHTPSIHTFSSSISSSSDLLSDEGSEDVLFITSSIFAGFRVLLFLLLGFLFRELAYIQRDVVDSVRHTFYIKSERRKAFYIDTEECCRRTVLQDLPSLLAFGLLSWPGLYSAT